MKKLLLILFLLSTVALRAQNVTAEKLIGVWKVTVVEFKGERLKATDPQTYRKITYTQYKEAEPGKALTALDSVEVEAQAEELYALVPGIGITFSEQEKFSMTIIVPMDGDEFKEEVDGTFKIEGGKLALTTKHGSIDTIGFSMPDNNTLVLINWLEEEWNLVLTRQ